MSVADEGRPPFLAELEQKWGRCRRTAAVTGTETPGAIFSRESWLWFPGGQNRLIRVEGRVATATSGGHTWTLSIEANERWDGQTCLTLRYTGDALPDELISRALILAGWCEPENSPDAADGRVRELTALAEDILSRFSGAKGDGQRARVGQVQMAHWRAVLDA